MTNRDAISPLVPPEADLRAVPRFCHLAGTGSLCEPFETQVRRCTSSGDRRRVRLSHARYHATHTDGEWQNLLDEFEECCVCCGRAVWQGNGWPRGYERASHCRELHKDHVVPIYMGGSDGIENIQPLCDECNCGKGPETRNYVWEYRSVRP